MKYTGAIYKAACGFPLTGYVGASGSPVSSITIPYPTGDPGDFLMCWISWTSWAGSLFNNRSFAGGNNGNFATYGQVRGADTDVTFRLPVSTLETGGPAVPSAGEVVAILVNIQDAYNGDPTYSYAGGALPIIDRASTGFIGSTPYDYAYTTDNNFALMGCLSSATSGTPGMVISGGGSSEANASHLKRRLNVISLQPSASNTYRFTATGTGAQVQQVRLEVFSTCSGWPPDIPD